MVVPEHSSQSPLPPVLAALSVDSMPALWREHEAAVGDGKNPDPAAADWKQPGHGALRARR